MGSTESGGGGGGGGCGVDTAPGSIVWVRRRNGSWWPGKILSPTQLPSTHLMSPRSGTPVKLLGREDASVDWYNLEKSKRVKAFRCGEFDDCIEKAEASFGLPAKKREKYARREDAIIHALELEKKLLEIKHGKVGALNSGRDISSGTEKRGLATPSRAVENCNEKLGSHELYQLDKKVDIPNRMENNIPPHSQTARGVTLSYLPECNNEAVHGIGGLKEFKLGTGTINKQIYAYAASDDPNKMVVDGHATAASDNDPSFENFSDSDSRNSIGKRKRLLGSLVEEPFLKRHNGHHMFPDYSLPSEGNCVSMYGKEQIVSSVQNSMYLTSGSLHPSDTNHGLQRQMDISASQLEAGDRHAPQDSRAAVSSSESSEETESDSSETQSVEHVDPGMLLSDAETHFRERPFTLDRFRRQSGHESTSSDESDGLSLDGPSPSGVGVSKWQLKGKRNLRSCIKKDRDLFAHRTYMEGKYGSPNQRDQRHDLSYYHDNDHNYDVDFIEDEFNTHTKGFGGRGYLASQALDQRQSSVGQGMMDWDDLTWGRPFRGYWEEKGGCSNSTFVSRDGQDILLDVELEVQANQQGERVPWVSLMSRLNGMAIVGHPILIESLEDGSTDILVSTSDVYGNLQHDSDRNRVQPMWRTARRTANFRVSRPHLSSTWDGDNDIDSQYFHQSGKVGANKSLGSSSLHRGNLSKKTHSPVSRSQGAKKPMRKTNSSSIQKTKALSSIGYDQKLNNQRRESSTNYLLGGVIKAVDCGPPTVACIPVKLVFSRLLEAVGRPPSGAARHGDSSQQL